MRYLSAAVVFCCCIMGSVYASPSNEEVLRAIGILKEPEKNAEALVDAAKLVMQFADESPDVTILVGAEATPWLTEKWKIGEEESNAARLLLASSYMAGSIEHQLAEGKSDKDPYYGWLLSNRIYTIIKPKWNFVSPGAEKLCKLQEQGKLKAYALKVMEKG